MAIERRKMIPWRKVDDEKEKDDDQDNDEEGDSMHALEKGTWDVTLSRKT